MMFLFAELTKEIVFVCTIFISFTLKITCEICSWYCHLHTHIFLQEEAFLLPFRSFLLFSFKN